MYELEFLGRIIEVDAELEKGYKSNSYEYPDDPDEVIINAIYYKGRNITKLLSNESYDEIMDDMYYKLQNKSIDNAFFKLLNY